MSYTFDGATKVISVVAQTVMSVRDVYSRWVDWSQNNAQWLPAFRTVGGDVIDSGAGTSIPIYAYLTNGWRIKPQESSHTLTVTSGILLVDGGGDPFISTTGNYNVRVNYQQPVQAITAGGSGSLTTEQNDTLVLIRKLLTNRRITDPQAGEQVVFDDDDITPLVRGDLWEDVAGTQQYRGDGSDRADRLE